MCGIMGYVGESDASRVIHEGLSRLDYRGYDSAGMAVLKENPGIQVKKGVGGIEEIHEVHDFYSLEGRMGIGHTRWATHGGVTRENAHPHVDHEGRLALVHNGIIENYEELREDLETSEFRSETDTEVVVHYLKERLDGGMEFKDAIMAFMDDAEGTFAVVVLDRETRKMYAMKHRSPLALGVRDGEFFIGSDIYAFSTYTDRALFFEDGEFAVISEEGVELFDSEGNVVDREAERFEWEDQEVGKEEYEHYMLKEIHEQPQAVERLLGSLGRAQSGELAEFAGMVRDAGKVIFTAAGSSYHASLLGVYYLQKAGVEAQALIASEFENYERVDDDTLVVAVSQSGETMDVLEAIRYSREHGAGVASVVNVPYSSIQRESDVSLEIHAGQEVCVAATKTFLNQVVAILSLVRELGGNVDLDGLGAEIGEVIERNEPRVRELAEELEDVDDLYVIGRGPTYPIAREIALKLKEIPYIHAEGMMGGELKHGTLALIEEGTPVMSLIPEKDDQIMSNVKEVEARGARSIRVSPYYGEFHVPEDRSRFAMYATTLGFLLSYYIARRRGLPIDKPRNLAKSVTVK